MEETQNTIDAVQEPSVEVQQESENIEDVDIPQTEEPKQSIEENRALAAMRRETQQLMKRAEKLLSPSFEGRTLPEILDIVEAEAAGVSLEQFKENNEKNKTVEQLQQDNEFLNQKIIENIMEKDLRAIKKIDKEVKSLDELGEYYFKCIGAGMDGIEAYHAVKAKQAKTMKTPPQEIGQLGRGAPEVAYTREVVKNMSSQEVKKNYEKIRKDMEKW